MVMVVFDGDAWLLEAQAGSIFQSQKYSVYEARDPHFNLSWFLSQQPC
jgi:hypothetical protein